MYSNNKIVTHGKAKLPLPAIENHLIVYGLTPNEENGERLCTHIIKYRIKTHY